MSFTTLDAHEPLSRGVPLIIAVLQVGKLRRKQFSHV